MANKLSAENEEFRRRFHALPKDVREGLADACGIALEEDRLAGHGALTDTESRRLARQMDGAISRTLRGLIGH